MSGWIAVTRTVFKHHMFAGETYSKRDAWLYMVALANWEGADCGVFSCFENELATAFGWSKSKVHRFIKTLIQESMLEPVGEPVANRFRTSYRVVNFKRYQLVTSDSDTEHESVVNQKRTRSRTSSIYKDLNKQETITKTQEETPLPPFEGHEAFQKALADWISFKWEQFKFKYKPTALRGLYSKLEELGPERATAAIQHSIQNGWKGIWEEKELTQPAKGQQFLSAHERKRQREDELFQSLQANQEVLFIEVKS